MDAKFKWNKSLDVIAREKTGGKEGILFLAHQAKAFMDPYVPARNQVLAQNVRVTAEEDCGHITYNSPYAHYQYEGEVYGPNIPIFEEDGETVSGWRSPPHKTPTGRKLEYRKVPHPLATSHWDKAMVVARGDELAKAYEKYLKGK